MLMRHAHDAFADTVIHVGEVFGDTISVSQASR